MTAPPNAKRCEKVNDGGKPCGGEVAWAYAIDIAVPGSNRRRRRVRSGFPTKAQALAALREAQEADSTGRLVPTTRVLLGGYLDQWLAGTRSRVGDTLTETGWRDYEVHVRRHIRPGIGDIPLQGLTRNHIKAFYGWVQDGHSTRQQEGRSPKRPSPKTVHNIHLTLHRALQDAVDDGLIARNPAAGAREAPKVRREMQTWDAEQLAQFLSHTQDDRLFPLWRLASMSGLRRGELLGLFWRDLDFKALTLTVSRQWKRGERGFVLAPPKTDRGRRTIDLDAETMAALRSWKRGQLEEQVAYAGEWEESGHVFSRVNGRAHDVDVVSQQFDKVVAATELPRIRFHDLRHTHATLLLLDGTPAHVVSVRLGHRNVAFTLQQYAHVLPQQQADAVERLARRIADGRS